jgi:hypothetical protein
MNDMSYSLLVSTTTYSGSTIKDILLDDLFICVAWGRPGELISQLDPGTNAWSIGISDEGELLNPVGDIAILKAIFMLQGRLQVSQNAGIKCRKEIASRLQDAITAAGIEASSFFSSIEEDEWDDIVTWRADFDLINGSEDSVSFDSSELFTAIYDDDSGELRTVPVRNGNSRLAAVTLYLDADLLEKTLICYVADGTPVTKGNPDLDDGLYIGPRSYIVLEIEADGGFENFRLDQNGFEDL